MNNIYKMESLNNYELKISTRHSKKVKNFFIEKNCNSDVNKNEVIPKSASQHTTSTEEESPNDLQCVLKEVIQTPRRSCRKSIKPTQDYDDIINKSLRSCTRSTRKCLVTALETEDAENREIMKWTPAKVGRVSQKRGRKSRRTGKLRKYGEKKLEQAGYKNEDYDAERVYNSSQNNEQLSNVVNDISLTETTIEQKKSVEEVVDHIGVLNVLFENKNAKENIYLQLEKTEVDDLKEHNEPLRLIDIGSNDDEVSAKVDQENCIMFQSNANNMKKENNILGISPKRNKLEDGYDCYLKSENSNISDLGLKPLKEEEESTVKKVENEEKSVNQETDEMPSLIIWENDEELKTPNKLNETFVANDFVMAFGINNENSVDHTEEIMETLQLSDDDSETLKIPPRITKEKENNLKLTTKVSAVEVKVHCTSKAFSASEITGAEKQAMKAIRLHTPYKKQQRIKGNSDIKKFETNISSKNPLNTFTTLKPKEIVLLGIRKRSLSVCIDGHEQKRSKYAVDASEKVKQDRAVSFHSPANQIITIDDFDIKISNSLKKDQLEKDSFRKYVTTRRKRSLSLDESIISNPLMPRPVMNIGDKTQMSVPKLLLRTKLPNFAAIHQKQFKKMENLVEHVNRKQERSKNLINSAAKLTSAKKNIPIKDNTTNVFADKPKAFKINDLGNIGQMSKSFYNSTAPKLSKNEVIKFGKVFSKPPQQQQIKKYLKQSQAINIETAEQNIKTVAPIKPKFNLSTSLLDKPTTSSKYLEKVSENKMSSRLQRHMDLFKGRVAATKTGVSLHKNVAIPKGVKSNRRFELQMQHRKNLDQ